jgi:hypothetical protein
VNTGLWKDIPPISTISTQSAIKHKLWGVFEPSMKGGVEWHESPKLVFEVGETVFEFYRHPELFGSMRCDRLINKWVHYKNNNINLPPIITGWERQAFAFYESCYTTASEKNRILEDGKSDN